MQKEYNRFSRRRVRREKHISACKRASAASALPQAAIFLKKVLALF